MKRLSLILIVAILSAGLYLNKTVNPEKDQSLEKKEYSLIIQAAKDAYLFGYPLMVMDVTRKTRTNTDKPNTKGLLAPLNQLVSANRFPDHNSRDVVRPNCDTYYTSGWLDLSNEPLVLELPNTNDRYYLFPMLDAWTNVFFSPGKRTSGTDAQTYLITYEEWKGIVPNGMKQVNAPTNIVWLLGRTQVNNSKDGSTVVKKIQEGYKLTPLSSYGKPYTPPAGKAEPVTSKKTTNESVTDMTIADYFNALNQLMLENPPADADTAIMKRLARIGVAPGANFNLAKFTTAMQDSLKAIPVWAKRQMQKGLTGSEPVNGWFVNRGLGNYGTNYALRADIAYGGLGAYLDADAIYPVSITDADGEGYDGSKNKYVLHFDKDKTPPANAFWSLTMYSIDGFLCENPIRRYAIGDRDPLKKNPDGSIDIYIQKDNPGKDKESNWLPAPATAFNLLLRVYWPKEEMLSGSWQTPAVKKNSMISSVQQNNSGK